MKKIRCAMVMWAIFAIVSRLDSRFINGNASQISLLVGVIYLATGADAAVVGENNNADIPVDLTGVTTLVGLRNAIAASVRTWATDHGFTVNPNNVLVPTYQQS